MVFFCGYVDMKPAILFMLYEFILPVHNHFYPQVEEIGKTLYIYVMSTGNKFHKLMEAGT